ncbi:uncharacterized protein LOC103721483 [Phoenix dactylifera]|uniref:Uncharacterized protein LOC103721483 n=1 Tax=Phoenix dactylifera TaxID=42345 RepID=A0A8B8ZGQ5_PHODC|nr:uncharacterized protein LOC103721483 [Phoenix dactylifera]
MYPIERFLMRLKDYVRNRAYPEGSISEGYIAEECLTFCSRYLEGVETALNRPPRNFDIVENAEIYKFSSAGRVLGTVKSIVLDQKSLAQAHRYVLLHNDIISEYRRESITRKIKKQRHQLLEKILLGSLPYKFFLLEADKQGRERLTRGSSRARDVWQLREDEKIVVECNELEQPIKRAGSLLSSFLGSVARRGQLCPLNYHKWNDMLPSYKVELLKFVQKKFVLPPESHDWVLKSLNRKWKEYKSKLKADWKREGMTEEEVARVCPPDVYHHQWRELVHYWFSERGQTYSDIGRAARASQTIHHTSGSKSYARLRVEFMEDHGRKPDEVEFYKMTHTHRDGSFV